VAEPERQDGRVISVRRVISCDATKAQAADARGPKKRGPPDRQHGRCLMSAASFPAGYEA